MIRLLLNNLYFHNVTKYWTEHPDHCIVSKEETEKKDLPSSAQLKIGSRYNLIEGEWGWGTRGLPHLAITDNKHI